MESIYGDKTSITYSVKGDTIEIKESYYMLTETYKGTFKLENNVLTLTWSGGDTWKYVKAISAEEAKKLGYEYLTFKLDNDGTYYVAGFAGEKSQTEIEIPAEYGGIPVSSIGYKAFKYNDVIEKVIIKDGVKTISAGAFSNCKSLKSVVIPDSVTEINGEAFIKCESLKSITLPANCVELGAGAFEDCKALEEVKLPANLKIIGSRAFNSCSSLEKIDLPNSLKVIGESAFSSTGLIKIDLPDGFEKLGRQSLEYCTGIKNLVLPESLTEIGPFAFKNIGGEDCNISYKGTVAEFEVLNEKTKDMGYYGMVHCTDGDLDLGRFW